MSTPIGRDEWLKALSDAGFGTENDPDAITITEFAKMVGVGRLAAQARLEELVRTGKAVETKKWSLSASGLRRGLSRAFRLVETPPAKRRVPRKAW